MIEAARGTGLSVHRVRDIGPDYAITLRAWRDAWEREKEVRRAGGRAPPRGRGGRSRPRLPPSPSPSLPQPQPASPRTPPCPSPPPPKQQAVLALGYSQRFWLKYQFYFAYCEAAFDAK
jgi:cyclopropane-fatty-acyl-phospholipid synthase